MKKLFTFSLLAVIALASCTKQVAAPEKEQSADFSGKMKTITVVANLDTKTTLDSNHERLQWSTGDAVSLFNNQDNTNTELTYSAGDMTVSVPAATTEIYCHYPYYAGNTSGPSNVSVYINNSQTQTNPGELNGYFYPMVAKGTIGADDKAIVSFYPVASALALNIYHTGLVGTEKVSSVKVTPTANTGFIKRQYLNLTEDGLKYNNASGSDAITVTLTNPLTLANTKPSDSQKFDGQIYICLAKQSYTAIKFEITTDKGVYTITSNSTVIDCINKDFVPININLNKAIFEDAEPDYVTLDWTYPTGAAAATRAGITAINGVTANGLGTDYGDTHSPYKIKFDDTGDYIQIKTNTSINTVSVKYKMIGGNTTSTLNIKESENGSSWTSVEDLSISGSQNSTGTLTTSNAFKSASRYVQIYFTKGANVGIGGVTITKSSTDPLIANAIIEDASARGGSGLTKNISLSNYDSAPSLTATPDGVTVTAATVDNVTTTGAIVTYTLAPNYSGAAAVGTITISDGITSGTVTVNQVADVFSTTASDPLVIGQTSGATKTCTIKSDFDWTIDDNHLTGATISPKSFTYSSSQNQTITFTTTAANAETTPADLGYIVVTRTADGATLTINLQQKGVAVGEELPFNWDGGKADATANMTISAGSNYSSAPKIRFDTQGSSKIIVRVASAASSFSFLAKQNGTATNSVITLSGSTDGSSYTDIESFTINPGNSKTATYTSTQSINSSYRYLRILLTTKGSSTNIGVGSLHIE